MIRDPETFTILLDTLRRFVRERLIPGGKRASRYR
jgi:hypothetical protein